MATELDAGTTPSCSTRPPGRRSIRGALTVALGALAMLAGLGVLTVLAQDAAAASVPGIQSKQWVNPISQNGHPEVVHDFDPPTANWLAGHRGVDLLASSGQQVVSAGAGEVTYASPLVDRGVVVVNHGDLRTTYEPVDASVTLGQRVSAGDPIGTIGSGGHCSSRCLHWGLRRGEEYLNPLTLISLQPPVLKSLQNKTSVVDTGTERAATRNGRESKSSPDSATVRGETSSRAGLATAGIVVAGLAASGMLRRRTAS